MIMDRSNAFPLPMRPPSPAPATAPPSPEAMAVAGTVAAPSATPEVPAAVGRLLEERLELVEDLWLTVLRSECPPAQLERLIRLKELSGPLAPSGVESESDAEDFSSGASEAIVAVIREMDLADGIAAARAFSLYFQLVNILEQHIEEDSYLASLQTGPSASVNDPFLPALASQSEPATFRQLFERLRALGVPPAQIENLLRDLDIRLVFTAHPTEIVRHTVRHKQRRVASLIQKLEEGRGAAAKRANATASNWKRRSASGGAPMNCTSSNPRCSMRWITPSTTSSRCSSMRCRSCSNASAQPWPPTTPTCNRPWMPSAPSGPGWDPTGTATPR